MNWDARSAATRQTYRNLSLDQLRGLILDGELGEADWVTREGERTWLEIGVVPELADALPAFTFRRGAGLHAVEEDMDMTPMIDVVFQLLLFFMIIFTFQVQKSIDIPQSDRPDQAQQAPTLGQIGRDHVVVAVGAKNQIELLHYNEQNQLAKREPLSRDGQSLQETVEKLVSRFEEIAREELKTSVIIDGDDQAWHETVVAVIDAASRAQMQDIRIAQPVERKSEGKTVRPGTTVQPAGEGPPGAVRDK